MTGTYLGKKKILNLEAGFITQQNATWTGSTPGPAANDPTRKYYDMNLWSVAVFYDSPLNSEKGTALNAYVGYFNTDYGQNYLRYNGIMNPANGTTLASVPGNFYGNAFPMFGTGHVIYAQAGYLLRKDLLGDQGTLMPYITYQGATYNRLDKTMSVWDIGVNWLLKGHTAKFSLDYQIRPTYSVDSNDTNHLVQDKSTKGQWVLQYQFFF
jgi:hypothetical protein